MNDYADTGFLCSLYAPDAHSPRAIKAMVKQQSPLAYTWIHQLEYRNTLRLRVFRKEITAALAAGSKTFLSFDTRQTKLAKAAGLKVKSL